MNKFEQDFEKLVKFNERIVKAKKELEDLELELVGESRGFLEKYNIEKNIRRLGSVENYLNRGVSVKQLVDLIKQTNENRGKGYVSLPELKEHMTGIKLDNNLLNYNQEVIKEIESNYRSLDSIENIESLNNLTFSDTPYYLIDERMAKYLRLGHNPGVKRINDENQFVYMVVFNTIKRVDKIVLIYNYIAYNKIFLRILYAYVSLEQKKCLFSEEKGYVGSDYFFVLDKKLMDKGKSYHLSDIESEIIKNGFGLLGRSSYSENLLNNY